MINNCNPTSSVTTVNNSQYAIILACYFYYILILGESRAVLWLIWDFPPAMWSTTLAVFYGDWHTYYVILQSIAIRSPRSVIKASQLSDLYRYFPGLFHFLHCQRISGLPVAYKDQDTKYMLDLISIPASYQRASWYTADVCLNNQLYGNT